MESIREQRRTSVMTAAKRRADTIQKIREMRGKGWTTGQIAAWMHLTESSVMALLKG